MNLGEATLESMKELEGTVFDVDLPEDGGTVKMTLEEVVPFELRSRRRLRNPKTKREPFAMYFVAPPELPVLPQQMYTMRSEKANFDSIFIVPVGQDETGTEYEAVFA